MSQFVSVAPSALPSVPLDERSALPDTAAIYFVIEGDTVLYVGQSINLHQRWLAHHRLTQLNEYGGCRIAWMQVDDADLLDELERACIEHFSPVLNGTVQYDVERWALTIRLPRELEVSIRRLARERLVQPSVVVRQLVKERLDELERYQGV